METIVSAADGLQLRAISFGFGHGDAPPADLVLDVREWFRDPHVSAAMRSMNGRDHAVVENVLSAAGAIAFVDRIFAAVGELVRLRLGPVTVGVGCAGGRHRSTVIADQLYFRARSAGWVAEVVHRDLERPVLGSRRKTAADGWPARHPR